MELINSNLIKLKADLSSKDEVIAYLADLIHADGRLNDYDAFVKNVFEREEQISTNLGEGIAMPHGKTNAVKDSALALVTLNKPVAWGDEDKPVSMVFEIAVPDSSDNLHLKILASLSRKLIYDDFRNSLLKAKNSQEVLVILESAIGGIQ